MMTAQKRQVPYLIGGLIACVLGVGVLPSAARAGATEDNCHAHVLETERKLNIPNGLLLSIALVESGYDGEPYPFTLTFGSRTRYVESANAAAKQLRDSKGRLRNNLFVGCMQLSLRHHSSHFRPVEKIIDPQANVWYAGGYLVRLHGQVGSWGRAVARYNGGSHRQSLTYVCKVWNNLVQLDAGSAKLLRADGCSQRHNVEIAPRTRRAFNQAQVAAAPE
ncbi:MAG: transglycosylase SLT domain-containing protein [Azospirillum sp.]|nr:transglycosylase SLT domain-containing protein [Azospirillum sp.]